MKPIDVLVRVPGAVDRYGRFPAIFLYTGREREGERRERERKREKMKKIYILIRVPGALDR